MQEARIHEALKVDLSKYEKMEKDPIDMENNFPLLERLLEDINTLKSGHSLLQLNIDAAKTQTLSSEDKEYYATMSHQIGYKIEYIDQLLHLVKADISLQSAQATEEAISEELKIIEENPRRNLGDRKVIDNYAKLQASICEAALEAAKRGMKELKRTEGTPPNSSESLPEKMHDGLATKVGNAVEQLLITKSTLNKEETLSIIAQKSSRSGELKQSPLLSQKGLTKMIKEQEESVEKSLDDAVSKFKINSSEKKPQGLLKGLRRRAMSFGGRQTNDNSQDAHNAYRTLRSVLEKMGEIKSNLSANIAVDKYPGGQYRPNNKDTKNSLAGADANDTRKNLHKVELMGLSTMKTATLSEEKAIEHFTQVNQDKIQGTIQRSIAGQQRTIYHEQWKEDMARPMIDIANVYMVKSGYTGRIDAQKPNTDADSIQKSVFVENHRYAQEFTVKLQEVASMGYHIEKISGDDSTPKSRIETYRQFESHKEDIQLMMSDSDNNFSEEHQSELKQILSNTIQEIRSELSNDFGLFDYCTESRIEPYLDSAIENSVLAKSVIDVKFSSVHSSIMSAADEAKNEKTQQVSDFLSNDSLNLHDLLNRFIDENTGNTNTDDPTNKGKFPPQIATQMKGDIAAMDRSDLETAIKKHPKAPIGYAIKEFMEERWELSARNIADLAAESIEPQALDTNSTEHLKAQKTLVSKALRFDSNASRSEREKIDSTKPLRLYEAALDHTQEVFSQNFSQEDMKTIIYQLNVNEKTESRMLDVGASATRARSSSFAQTLSQMGTNSAEIRQNKSEIEEQQKISSQQNTGPKQEPEPKQEATKTTTSSTEISSDLEDDNSATMPGIKM